MSLFDLFFGKQKEQSAIAEITGELKSRLEPILQSHFLDYQKKIGLLSRFENTQIKARDFTKRFKKLCKLSSRGQIGSFEKREIAKILSLLSSAIDTEQNLEIKDLEKKEKILLAALSEQIDNLAANLEAQHSWVAENLSSVESSDNIADLKELLIEEGRIIYKIEETDLPKIHAEIDLILHKTKYPEGSSMAEKMLKEKQRRKKWLESKAKKGFVTLYHAYAKRYGKSALVKGELLDPKRYPAGFYMTENDQEAVDAIIRFKGGKYSEKEIIVLRIEIQIEVFEKLINIVGSEVAWNVYYTIPIENFDKANREIKRGFIRFSRF